MRSQEKAIIEAVTGGVFNLEAPFLSKAELMEITAAASAYLGVNPARLTRNNLDSWYRLGILAEPKRTERNRLFSALDVFYASAVFHLSSCGIPLAACTEVVRLLAEWLNADDNAQRAPKALDPEGLSKFEVRDLIVLSSVDGGLQIACFDSPEELALQAKRSAVNVLFNAATVLSFTAAVSRQKWNEKAESLLRKIDLQIARKQGDKK